MTQITVAELRNTAELFFSYLESKDIKSVTFSEDYYWDVPAEIRYNPYQQPTEHTIGQLSDDLAELRRMTEGSRPVIAYGLVWLAALLRRVGEVGETAKC
jgi:hypothetical protein